MATISHRNLKNGQNVYDIQICIDGKFRSMSWRQPKELTDKKEVNRIVNKIAIEFEEKQRTNLVDYKDNITFEEFANQWLKDCKRNHSLLSYSRNKVIISNVNKFIGGIPLNHLKPIHIKKILDYLNDKVIINESAKLKKDLDEIIKDRKIRQISKNCEISFTTFLFARKRHIIKWENAEAIAKELKINVSEYFDKIVQTRPYSKGSKDKYKVVVNSILNRAVQLELIPSNPAKKVFIKNAISGEEKEKEILDLAETKAFQKALLAINDPNQLREKTSMALFFYMAMRLGEVAGLEWKDIDFCKNTINIQRSTSYSGSEFGTITKEPKTKTSKRKIKMPKVMVSILKEYKVKYDYEKQRLGDAWIDKDRVICRPNGDIITPGTMRLWLKKFLIQNNLKVVSPHSLRHTNITIQLRNKIQPKAVARFVGHSDASVTLDVYSHFLKEDEDDYVELFDNLFKEKA